MLKCINKLLDHFDAVVISEFWENNFKLKIKKSNNMSVTIGFMFGLIEDQVKIFFILEECKFYYRVFYISNLYGTNF